MRMARVAGAGVALILGASSAACVFKGEGASFTCENLEARSRECAVELAQAQQDGVVSAQSQAFSADDLQAQCITFPERREPMGLCFQAEECSTFASCYTKLATDSWSP